MQAHHTGYRKMLQCTSMKPFVPSVLMTHHCNDKLRDMLRRSTDKGCMGLMYSRWWAESHGPLAAFTPGTWVLARLPGGESASDPSLVHLPEGRLPRARGWGRSPLAPDIVSVSLSRSPASQVRKFLGFTFRIWSLDYEVQSRCMQAPLTERVCVTSGSSCLDNRVAGT